MPTVLTLGNFDGVHRGHRAILDRARQFAQSHGPGGRVVVLSFDRHPAAVLRPGAQPPRLLSNPAKVARLKRAGADEVHLLPAGPQLFSQSPEQFVDDLVRRFAPAAFVEGPDFRFGKGRAGDMDTLAELGRSRGFEVAAVPPIHVTLSDWQRARCSSSLARWLIGRGRTRDCARCLTVAHELTAAVVRGEKQGRTLGVPTANLSPDDLAGFIIPADGVYAGYAAIHPPASQPASAAPPRPLAAAISVGVKPTFGRKQLTVEAHLLGGVPGPADDLYGRTLTLRFAHWVRDQYAFPGLPSLRAQLCRDLDAARACADADAAADATAADAVGDGAAEPTKAAADER